MKLVSAVYGILKSAAVDHKFSIDELNLLILDRNYLVLYSWIHHAIHLIWLSLEVFNSIASKAHKHLNVDYWSFWMRTAIGEPGTISPNLLKQRNKLNLDDPTTSIENGKNSVKKKKKKNLYWWRNVVKLEQPNSLIAYISSLIWTVCKFDQNIPFSSKFLITYN